MPKEKYSFTLNVEVAKKPRSFRVIVRPEELLRMIEGSARALSHNKTLEFVFMPSRNNPERWQALVNEVST